MATSREVPGWYDETHYYLVVAGPVESRTDGQVHHVTAGILAGLYGLSTRLPNVVLCQSASQAMEYARTLQLRRASDPLVIHTLYPESSGDYSMPQDVRMWQAMQRRIVAEGRVGVGASAIFSAAESAHGIVAGRPAHVSGGSGGASSSASFSAPPGVHTVSVNISGGGGGGSPGVSTDSDRAQAMRLMIANLVREGAPGMARAADSMRRFAEAVGGVPVVAPVVHDSWIKPSEVPKDGSRSWIRVVKKGCVGERDAQGDFSCPDYAWGCDQCPVVVERMREEERQGVALKGNRMHRFWRSKRKAQQKNEIDFTEGFEVGVDPGSPEGDRTVLVVGRMAGRATLAKKYHKE